MDENLKELKVALKVEDNPYLGNREIKASINDCINALRDSFDFLSPEAKEWLESIEECSPKIKLNQLDFDRFIQYRRAAFKRRMDVMITDKGDKFYKLEEDTINQVQILMQQNYSLSALEEKLFCLNQDLQEKYPKFSGFAYLKELNSEGILVTVLRARAEKL